MNEHLFWFHICYERSFGNVIRTLSICKFGTKKIITFWSFLGFHFRFDVINGSYDHYGTCFMAVRM